MVPTGTVICSKKKIKRRGTRIDGHPNTEIRAKLEKNQTIDKSITK